MSLLRKYVVFFVMRGMKMNVLKASLIRQIPPKSDNGYVFRSVRKGVPITAVYNMSI